MARRYDIAGLARRFAADSPNDLSEGAVREYLKRAAEQEPDPGKRRLIKMIKPASIRSALGLCPPRRYYAGGPCN